VAATEIGAEDAVRAYKSIANAANRYPVTAPWKLAWSFLDAVRLTPFSNIGGISVIRQSTSAHNEVQAVIMMDLATPPLWWGLLSNPG